MGVYEPLTQYLSRAESGSVQLTFQEIEELLKRPLPQSAYRYREWWSNNTVGHSHARSWVDAGWRTQNVDVDNRILVFLRAGSPGLETRKRDDTIPDPFGRMRGSVTFVPGIDLTEPTGEEWDAER